jgi:hypothetical protein
VGGQLVKMAFAAAFYETHRGRPMTKNEVLILVYMASLAMDTDAVPAYWGGQDTLGECALFRRVDDRATCRSVRETVRVAVKGLVERGAIKRLGGGYPGRSAEYAITLQAMMPHELAYKVGSALRHSVFADSPAPIGE